MTEPFFDKEFRLEQLERYGNPLTKLNELISWEDFYPELEYIEEERRGQEESGWSKDLRYLSLADWGPDEKTVRAFRKKLGKLGLDSKLFEKFDGCLRKHGFSVKTGQILDASIVSSPKQRNTRDKNKEIKDGFEPDVWR